MKNKLDNSSIQKSTWTDIDYQNMVWTDCKLYGFIIERDDENWTSDLLFDIDYILSAVQSEKPSLPVNHWISPCTMIFKNVFDLNINIDYKGGGLSRMEIGELYLTDTIKIENNKWVNCWCIHLDCGFITFKSGEMRQIQRLAPILTDTLELTLQERQGVGFKKIPYDEK
ncbi:MAG: hypothetical protein MH137_00845 [Flavobacteriales bacterium]|nr:hypothetical protein [Flavobacteriales bacterium]